MKSLRYNTIPTQETEPTTPLADLQNVIQIFTGKELDDNTARVLENTIVRPGSMPLTQDTDPETYQSVMKSPY